MGRFTFDIQETIGDAFKNVPHRLFKLPPKVHFNWRNILLFNHAKQRMSFLEILEIH